MRLLRVTNLPVGRRLEPGEHARLWVSGAVKKIESGGNQEVAVVNVSDWELDPVCPRCETPV